MNWRRFGALVVDRVVGAVVFLAAVILVGLALGGLAGLRALAVRWLPVLALGLVLGGCARHVVYVPTPVVCRCPGPVLLKPSPFDTVYPPDLPGELEDAEAAAAARARGGKP